MGNEKREEAEGRTDIKIGKSGKIRRKFGEGRQRGKEEGFACVLER